MYQFTMSLEDKWKKAVNNLEEFYKMMELIKQFPLKQLKEVRSLPYEIEGPIQYLQSYS